MNEKGNKAVELKDEEMEKVAGGKPLNGSEIPEGAPACYQPAGPLSPRLYSSPTCNSCSWSGGCSRRP